VLPISVNKACYYNSFYGVYSTKRLSASRMIETIPSYINSVSLSVHLYVRSQHSGFMSKRSKIVENFLPPDNFGCYIPMGIPLIGILAEFMFRLEKKLIKG